MLFILPEKLFSFPRYLNSCLDFSVIYKNGLIRKITLISKIMASQPAQKIAIHILRNVSSCKSNPTMKFGQFKEYSMRNIFLQKSYRKCDRETVPRPFPKNIKIEHVPGYIGFIHFVFILG